MSIFSERRETITDRVSATYLGYELSFTTTINGLLLHWEGATRVFDMLGTRTGSTAARITSNGTTVTLDGPWPPNVTICTLKTPTANGSTKTLTGDFSSDANWTKGAGWTIGSGVATHATANATALAETATTIVNGETYLITYTIKTVTTAGTLTPSAGGVTLTPRTTTGTFEEEIVATSTAALTFTADATWAGTIDDVSTCKVTPAVVSIIAWR